MRGREEGSKEEKSKGKGKERRRERMENEGGERKGREGERG